VFHLQVPLVGAPAADDWEPTKALRDTIETAILRSDASGLREALAGLSPEQAEKVLTTGEWAHRKWASCDSAIHYAALKCSDVAVLEVLLHDRQHLLNMKDQKGRTPLHFAARRGSVDVVEKFVEWGGKELLEALSENGRTPLHDAAMRGNSDVVEWILNENQDLLKIKNDDGETPLDFALKKPKVVVAMVGVDGDVVMELLERGAKMPDVAAQDLEEVVPFAKGFLKDRSESLGLDCLRCCSVFRRLMQTRSSDSLTDDLAKIGNWLEALIATFCADTKTWVFRKSLEGKERDWFALLESSEPLQVVTQANCISLVEKHWKEEYENWSMKLAPRDVFISRVLSMLLMVAFVLLHIESIKGDSDVMLPGVWPLVWLWGSVLTGAGFMTQKSSKASV